MGRRRGRDNVRQHVVDELGDPTTQFAVLPPGVPEQVRFATKIK